MNILGLIIARSGSKGLPNKNILKLGKKSLIEISADVALKSKLINKIIFSTDDILYANLVKKKGVDVPFIRPKNLADNKASSWDVARHAIKWLDTYHNWKTDIIVLLQPTTPLRKVYHIDSVIKKILKEKYLAAMTIRKVDYPVEWMFKISNKKIAPLIKKSKKIKRRQDSKIVYQPAGTAYAALVERLKLVDPMKYSKLGYVIVPYEESINIDNPQDFEIAKNYWKIKDHGTF